MPTERPVPLCSAARLTLESLGATRLIARHVDGDALITLDAGKPLALIAYLEAAPQQRVSREHCLDLLWADLEPEAAKHALRQTLWYIKRRLADGIITAAGDALVLGVTIECDRATLVAAAASGDHARVVELYKGDFLPGFAAPGGAELEQWADVERRRLRNLFYRSSEDETRRLLSSGRAREAIALARRARDLEPLHQPAWRLLLEALIAAADATGAQLEADALESIATREDIELEPPTRALIRVARQTPNEARPESERNRALVAELVGREREFAQILAAWDDARAGRGRHIHIRASAGLGKTRLLNDVHARLRASRARVRVARFRIGTREVPYVGAAEVAASLADLPGAKGVSSESANVLLALNPALSSIFQSGSAESAQGSDVLRRRAVALKDLLVTVSEDHPVALLVDDLHWCEESSRTLLTHLIDDLDQRRLLIVTTGRPTHAGKLETPQTLTIELPPLGEHETHAVVTSLAALPDAPWTTSFTSELLRASLGSPLRTLEMLQLLMDRALLERTAQEWRTPAPDRLMLALRQGDALKHRIEESSRSERWILLLLSVAGVPLPGNMLTELSQLPDAEFAHSLTTLEARGFVAHQGDALAPAHDEIAEDVVDLATPDALRAVHAALGKHLWQEAHNDLGTLRRAAAHLTHAEEIAALSANYLRFVRESRRLGDSRSHTALADDMLGSLTSTARVRDLVRSLPAHVRVGLTSGRRVAAAIVAAAALPLAVGMTAAIMAREISPPDAALVVFEVDQSSTFDGHTVPLRAAQWPVGTAIDYPRRADVRIRSVNGPPPIEIPGSPGSWLYGASVPDSGVIDVFRSDGNQNERLTFAPGDDNIESVSPDGRYAVISTARWHLLSHYDLAVLDLASGAVRRLTSGDNSDGAARWNLDGTQIAFVRRSFTELARRVCRISFDGSDMECIFAVSDVQTVVGWVDENRILVVHGADAQGKLAIVNLKDEELRAIRPDLFARKASIAPNGQYVGCLCSAGGATVWNWHIFPLARESESRVLDAGDNQESIRVEWRASHAPVGLQSLTINTPETTLQSGVPHQLEAAGTMIDGRKARPHWLRWSSSDPNVVEIDPRSGLTTPRHDGTATIVVGAGGRVRASRTVRVTSSEPVTINSEEWRNPLQQDWFVIGTPRPYVDTFNGRAVLRPNGDGSFESGVLSRVTINASDGAAVDAELSLRVTLPQWQVLGIGFDDIDAVALADSDAVLGQPREHAACVASFPAGENSAWADSISLLGSPERKLIAAPAHARDGAWVHVRVQILPDGRCGIALNGAPVFLSKRLVAFTRDPRVHVYGDSYHTDALVGRLTLRRGVPNDIDWAAFERHRRTPSAQERVSR